MLTLMERAPGEVRPLVRAIWDRGEEVPIPEGEEQLLRELLERHDALSETRELARRASLKAVESIAAVSGESKSRKLLMEIPELLLERSR